MNQELSDDDIERIRAVYGDTNITGHLARVRRLLKSAKPGNIPWQILENDYGFQGDWSPSDEGEPPKGAKW